jgi:hypothetical protein
LNGWMSGAMSSGKGVASGAGSSVSSAAGLACAATFGPPEDEGASPRPQAGRSAAVASARRRLKSESGRFFVVCIFVISSPGMDAARLRRGPWGATVG